MTERVWPHPNYRWTPLTVVILVSWVLAIVTLPWRLDDLTLGDWVGLPLSVAGTYWIVGGCARRGEPVARWLFHRVLHRDA